MKKRNLVALLTILLWTAMAFAQTARLSGRVMDPSGAVIPDAQIRASQETTVIKEVKSDGSGTFSLELPPGNYVVEVSAAEFRPYRQNVRVTPNMTPVTIRLTLGSVNTNVDVGSAGDQAVSVDSDASLTGTTLSGDTIQALPDDEDQLLAQLQQIAGASGSTQGESTLVVDGFTGGRVPPRDQIQQIIIETNTFSADSNGQPRIQIITRPGTGPWSGNVNFQTQNSALNAKNPFDTNKPSRRQHVFQTNYGGPVIPGKLTLRLTARSVKIEQEANSVLAITPTGPVNQGVFSPAKNQSASLTGQSYFTANNSLNFTANYNTNEQLNQGIGGFTLPERATNFKGHNWNFQLIDRDITTPRLVNEMRLFWFHNQNSLLPITENLAVNVLDAFNGGGAQNRTRRRGTNSNFGNTVRWTVTPALNLQLGTDFTYSNNYSNSEINYLGAFTFSSLDDYRMGRPILFRQTTGNPVVDFKQWEFATFVQADWRVNSKLNVGAGARYQAQTNLHDSNNLAPTLQFAYQPRNGTVLRAGGRISHQIFNIGYVEQLLRQDGLHQLETVITNPAYPDPFASGAGLNAGATAASLRVRESNLSAPYTINSAFTLEQNVTKTWRISASFDITRGLHLIRTRNINAPYPGGPLPDGLTVDQINLMRPFYPVVGNIYQFESSGSALSRNVNFRIFLPPALKVSRLTLTGFMQYTLGWTDDDASAMNQYDWRSEWTRATTDTRHRVQGNINVTMPWSTSMAFLIIGNSGRPYSVTTGRDDNGDQATNDRPAGAPRNSLTGPSTYNVDMNFTKQIPLGKRESGSANNAAPQVLVNGAPPPPGQVLIGLPGGPGAPGGPRLTFNAQIRNVLNNTQLRGYSGVITSPLFGKPTSAAPGRSVILGMTLSF